MIHFSSLTFSSGGQRNVYDLQLQWVQSFPQVQLASMCFIEIFNCDRNSHRDGGAGRNQVPNKYIANVGPTLLALSCASMDFPHIYVCLFIFQFTRCANYLFYALNSFYVVTYCSISKIMHTQKRINFLADVATEIECMFLISWCCEYIVHRLHSKKNSIQYYGRQDASALPKSEFYILFSLIHLLNLSTSQLKLR